MTQPSVTEPFWTNATTAALLLGAAHALVDAGCGYLIFRDVGTCGFPYPAIVSLVVLYNVLAFGGQVPVGALTDRLRAYRGLAAAGALTVALAVVLGPHVTTAAVVVAGVGNAFFHVGAGGYVLKESGERSAESGVFVGPGAVGLCAGILLGLHRLPARWALVGLLVAAAALTPAVGRRIARSVSPPALPPLPTNALVLALIVGVCLLGSVTVRALVGGTVSGAWRGVSTVVIVALAIAACGGKMLGGFIGDRLGWATTSIAALLLSAPLVSFLVRLPAGAVAGMLVFQMTMAITLKATHSLLPARPGLAFGIPPFALIVGALPGLYGVKLLPSGGYVLACVLGAAILVGLALRLLASTGASGGPSAERLRFLGAAKTKPA